MPFYVYIIVNKEPKKRTYVGWTNNIKKRLELHNTSKGAKFTRGSKWVLLYKETLETKSLAMKREHVLKKDQNFRNSIRQKLT